MHFLYSSKITLERCVIIECSRLPIAKFEDFVLTRRSSYVSSTLGNKLVAKLLVRILAGAHVGCLGCQPPILVGDLKLNNQRHFVPYARNGVGSNLSRITAPLSLDFTKPSPSFHGNVFSLPVVASSETSDVV